MKKILTLALVSAALTASSAFAATIQVYTASGAFNSSAIVAANGAGATFTENFNTNASLFTTFNAAGTVNGLPGFSGGPADGQRDTRVTSSYSEVITLNSGNMTAFGATWNVSVGGLGSGLKITVALLGGGTQVVELSPGVAANLGYNVGPDGGGEFFFGFTSDVAFTSVTLSGSNTFGLTNETLNFDDLLVEQAGAVVPPVDPPSGVPEPSTFGMVGAAMVGLGLIRKFRS
ncbi:MAG: PEP-CTERM sorting domain-containing protein [Bryobacteraceae bacterium]